MRRLVRLSVRATPAIVALLLGAACAPNGVVLRSNHYRVVVPNEWHVSATSGGSDEPTVLRVPASPAAGQSGLELRLYAWVAPWDVQDPVREAMKRLAGQKAAGLDAATVAPRDRCGERIQAFWMFGKPQPVAYLKMPSQQLLIVTAGTAEGSLVAAVGYVRDEEPFCENVASMTTALGQLRTSLLASRDVTGIPDTQRTLPTVQAGLPDVSVPPPKLDLRP